MRPVGISTSPYLLIDAEGQLRCAGLVLPESYHLLVPSFYARGGRKTLETLAGRIRIPSLVGESTGKEFKFAWNETIGLEGINFSTQAAFFMNDDQTEFLPHNLTGVYVPVAISLFTTYLALLNGQRIPL